MRPHASLHILWYRQFRRLCDWQQVWSTSSTHTSMQIHTAIINNSDYIQSSDAKLYTIREHVSKRLN